ncbi:MAG: ATP-dependent helicase [Spirochaetaceae bacterium]|jgi:DNA helicase-2/ATP-dependent DNA helicase PcrA|nr:ATP-dependent helicase [Spirochaetaceae bacterium]
MQSELDRQMALLNPEQLAAVTHEGSPLLILAGAGSGKTRVITTKIAWLIGERGVDPRSILAVTFTKKAATEMASRAVALESAAQWCRIHTFHSFGARFLRRYAGEAGVDQNFTVYDDDDAVTILAKVAPNLSRQQAARFAHRISLAKDYCLDPEDVALPPLEAKKGYETRDRFLGKTTYPAACDGAVDSGGEFSSLYAAYQGRLRETGNVDFGDLIRLPVKLLEENQGVRRETQSRYRIILVDEYQDSNVAQFRLLRALTGSGTYLCVVGDDDQSIYHFRGAEVDNILGFQGQFPGTTMIRLERNYRSVSPVLSVADSIVNKNTGRLGKTLRPERVGGKKPRLVFLPDQDDEAAFCGELVRQAYEKGVPYSHWAILYRMNAQSLGFETEFLRKQIPYHVVGALKFYEREEIKDALSVLAFLVNPKDEIAFARIVNKPSRGIGAVTVERIIERAREGSSSFLAECGTAAQAGNKKTAGGLRKFSGIMEELFAELHRGVGKDGDPRLSDLIALTTERTGLLDLHIQRDEITGTSRGANLQELANSALPYPRTVEGLLKFLDTIQLDRALDTGEEADNAVTLITLHNTKGLEFSRVVITGLESGVFPRADKAGDELEEERRLFYVGITRAKDELYITSCAERRLYGRTQMMIPSPFLYEIDRELFTALGEVPPIFARHKSLADAMAENQWD